MQRHHRYLLDEYGQPLNERLHGTLVTLAPRVQRQFPALTDDCAVTEILEEAGRRIASIEERKGPIDSLEAYAWTVVRRMASLRLRLDEWAIASATLPPDESGVVFDRLPSGFGTAEQIEARILCQQLFSHLTSTERQMIKGKQGGLSLEEIGQLHGISKVSALRAWRRLKRKLQGLTSATRRRSVQLAWKKSPDVSR